MRESSLSDQRVIIIDFDDSSWTALLGAKATLYSGLFSNLNDVERGFIRDVPKVNFGMRNDFQKDMFMMLYETLLASFVVSIHVPDASLRQKQKEIIGAKLYAAAVSIAIGVGILPGLNAEELLIKSSEVRDTESQVLVFLGDKRQGY